MSTQRCERAREWISLQFDGELSEFERALLNVHLERCTECRTFHADVEAIGAGLRATPLEMLRRPVALPRARRTRARAIQAVAAAAAVAAVGLGSTLGALRSEAPAAKRLHTSVRPAFLDSPDYELKLLLQHRQNPPVPTRGAL